MKKLLIGLTVLGLLAMVAGPAMAYRRPSSDIEVENENWAKVENDVTAVAKTGDNEIEGGGGFIMTGDAYADAYVENFVNINETKVKASCRRGCTGDIEVENENGARVYNDVTAVAETGDNEIEAGRSHHGSSMGGFIMTGDADSWSSAVNVVNSNVTRIRR